MYADLVAELKSLRAVPFAEHEWATRPPGNHATVQLDFAAAQDNGDDCHQDTAYQGSVDLYTKGQAWDVAAIVQHVLEKHCGSSWYLNLKTFDSGVRMIHREYVFEIEVL